MTSNIKSSHVTLQRAWSILNKILWLPLFFHSTMKVTSLPPQYQVASMCWCDCWNLQPCLPLRHVYTPSILLMSNINIFVLPSCNTDACLHQSAASTSKGLRSICVTVGLVTLSSQTLSIAFPFPTFELELGVLSMLHWLVLHHQGFLRCIISFNTLCSFQYELAILTVMLTWRVLKPELIFSLCCAGSSTIADFHIHGSTVR